MLNNNKQNKRKVYCCWNHHVCGGYGRYVGEVYDHCCGKASCVQNLVKHYFGTTGLFVTCTQENLAKNIMAYEFTGECDLSKPYVVTSVGKCRPSPCAPLVEVVGLYDCTEILGEYKMEDTNFEVVIDRPNPEEDDELGCFEFYVHTNNLRYAPDAAKVAESNKHFLNSYNSLSNDLELKGKDYPQGHDPILVNNPYEVLHLTFVCDSDEPKIRRVCHKDRNLDMCYDHVNDVTLKIGLGIDLYGVTYGKCALCKKIRKCIRCSRCSNLMCYGCNEVGHPCRCKRYVVENGQDITQCRSCWGHTVNKKCIGCRDDICNGCMSISNKCSECEFNYSVDYDFYKWGLRSLYEDDFYPLYEHQLGQSFRHNALRLLKSAGNKGIKIGILMRMMLAYYDVLTFVEGFESILVSMRLYRRGDYICYVFSGKDFNTGNLDGWGKTALLLYLKHKDIKYFSLCMAIHGMELVEEGIMKYKESDTDWPCWNGDNTEMYDLYNILLEDLRTYPLGVCCSDYKSKNECFGDFNVRMVIKKMKQNGTLVKEGSYVRLSGLAKRTFLDVDLRRVALMEKIMCLLQHVKLSEAQLKTYFKVRGICMSDALEVLVCDGKLKLETEGGHYIFVDFTGST